MKRLMTSKVSYNFNTMILLFQKVAMNLELTFDDSKFVALKLPLWVCGIYFFNENPLSIKPYSPNMQWPCL